jgi:peroxiredoxin
MEKSEATPFLAAPSSHHQAAHVTVPTAPLPSGSCCAPPRAPWSPIPLSDFADYTLFDAATKKPVVLSELWARQPVVLVFLRRLGCQLCRLRAAEMDACRRSAAALGCVIVCVTFEYLGEGSDSDKSWARAQCWGGPLLTDPSKTLYRALFRRKGFTDNFYGLFDASTARLKESSARGFGEGANFAGDGLMLGGTAVVDKGGAVLLDHRAQFFGDDASPEHVLAVLQTASGCKKVVAAGDGGAPSPVPAALPPSWVRRQLTLAPRECATPECLL